VQLAASQPTQLGFAWSIALSRMAFLVRAPFQRSTSGIDEETVPKTAAPRKGVQSAILWCSANFQKCGAVLWTASSDSAETAEPCFIPQ
jgi:hypothetical protein